MCAALKYAPLSSITSSTVERMVDRILEQSCMESFAVGSRVDDVFVGLCKACRVVLLSSVEAIHQNTDHSNSLSQTVRHRLLKHLWSVCLFPSSNFAEKICNSANGFCNSSQARQAAYMLICALLRSCDPAHGDILAEHSLLLTFGRLLLAQSRLWPAVASTSWTYDVRRDTVSSNNGFVGLWNQGATCYMNSLLQQLFHISSFRCGLLRITTDNEEEDPLTLTVGQRSKVSTGNSRCSATSILFELQVLFGNLSLSQKSSYDTLVVQCS